MFLSAISGEAKRSMTSMVMAIVKFPVIGSLPVIGPLFAFITGIDAAR